MLAPVAGLINCSESALNRNRLFDRFDRIKQPQIGAFDVRLGSEADMAASICDVRFTPESGHPMRHSECLLCANSGHCASFDHLVGCLQEGFRDCEAERFGGLEIDYQLILRRLLEREIGSLFTAQNAVDIDS
jgi:hypothetical protein